jgi:hypothetical protein
MDRRQVRPSDGLPQWACNTEDEAIASFVASKRKQIRILSSQLKRAEAELALVTHDQVFA